MATKIILTIQSRLQSKYGPDFPALQNLFTQLVNADAIKGLTTRFVFIDDVATAQKYGYPMPAVFDERACKNIVDHIFWKENNPEYLAIFGAQDVFPFQQLTNQLFGQPGGDPDKFIPSDLPYASDAPYSTDCNAFTSVTRVMGRIPDEQEAGNLDYVKTIIDQIIAARPANPASCNTYFANSAFVWTGSSQTSLRNIFGNSMSMKISPTDNTGLFVHGDIANLPHFFNLHGALNRTAYYGQQGNTYPQALLPSDLNGSVVPGSFVAAECCYGAQQLNRTTFGQSIADAYLQSKASVFMGSSTVSYGPPIGQGLADLITQYFMKNVLNGASSGRALLLARQKFLSVSGPTLDFHELKTLAQFYILGDPSVQPVDKITQEEAMETVQDRRTNMTAKGIQLGLMIPNTQKVEESITQGPAIDFKGFDFSIGKDFYGTKTVFEVEGSPSLNKMFPSKNDIFDGEILKTRFHVYQKGSVQEDGICDVDVLVIKERDNKVMGYRHYLSK